MKITVVKKGAPKHAGRDVCPWLIMVPPEDGK